MKKTVCFALTALLSACSLLPSAQTPTTYEGTLPCVDCEKIEAKLTLYPDNRYEYQTVYFIRGQQHPFNETGQYDPKQSKFITLENSGGLKLRVDQGYVEYCDHSGQSVKNANYKLNKVSP